MKYNADYYERGVQAGISCYENYRWLPEYTGPMAEAIVRFTGTPPEASVLDFGCAKGFLVRALRERGYAAWGCDVSAYAILNGDETVRAFLRLAGTGSPVPFHESFDLIVAKDVLEHVSPDEIGSTVTALRDRIKPDVGRMFVSAPLAQHHGGPYVLANSECDVTHTIREDLDGWRRIFETAQLHVVHACHRVTGIGEQYTATNNGVGFFVLKPRT